MRVGKKNQSTATPPTDDEPTTAHNFDERAAAFVRSHGGKWHVIRSDKAASPGHATPAQWLAWMEWFFRHTIPTRFKESHGVCTVPTEWPEEFDLHAEPSDRTAQFPAKPLISSQRRETVTAGLKELAGRMSAMNVNRAKGRVALTPDEVLADMKAAYARAPPPSASAELLQRMGISAPRDDDVGVDF